MEKKKSDELLTNTLSRVFFAQLDPNFSLGLYFSLFLLNY